MELPINDQDLEIIISKLEPSPLRDQLQLSSAAGCDDSWMNDVRVRQSRARSRGRRQEWPHDTRTSTAGGATGWKDA